MARRLAFAVRMPSVRPALALPSLRLPSRRSLAAAGALACLLALAYAAARETSLFAVRAVEVTGAPPRVSSEVRAALAGVVGTSLVAIDPGELERRLLELPSVRSARVDRAFPHRVAVQVEPERPLAVARQGTRAWVVARTGRVIRPAGRRALARLPGIRVPVDASLRPGEPLAGPRLAAVLRALRALPRRFPVRVLRARPDADGVTLVLDGWVALRLGPPVDVRGKLAAARAVLRSLSADERRELAYLDVSLPTRPVAASKTQVESES